MRKSILTACALALVFCVWLLMSRRPSERNAGIGDAPMMTINRASTNRSSPPPGTVDVGVKSLNQPDAPASTGILANQAEFNSTLLSQWQAPIDFYGKVVDESNNPVADVGVHFGWDEAPGDSGEKHSETLSDEDGMFGLHNARGRALEVKLNKDGYYSSRKDAWVFSYAVSGHYSADRFNPAIFHLRKKRPGADLITSENGVRPDVWVRVPKDDTPIRLDFVQKQASPNGQLEIRQNKPPWKTATSWSFSLSIPNGGLIENDDEFQFEAPDTNYPPTVQYDFTKSETNWITHITKQFYFTFGEPRQYGWLRLDSDIAKETVFVTYAINPSGSRNLEPAN